MLAPFNMGDLWLSYKYTLHAFNGCGFQSFDQQKLLRTYSVHVLCRCKAYMIVLHVEAGANFNL